MATRLLILGGTTEARALAGRIAAIKGYDGVLSLAGRTGHPLQQPLPTRTGGFGGASGLAAYLKSEAIAALIVATHPFAARIAANAAEAARMTGIPAVRLSRPPWRPVEGDDWRRYASLDAMIAGLAGPPLRLLVTIGRQDAARFVAASQHAYVFRSIEPIDLPPALGHAVTIEERGPFTLEGEVALMRRHAIEALVTKDSGGEATRAKLDSARELGLPVLMVDRPPAPALPEVASIDEVMTFLAHHAPPEKRGV
jgi:precorrin-6A/cobalt-precorrin-6A reductase